jgi:hypothetical protein
MVQLRAPNNVPSQGSAITELCRPVPKPVHAIPMSWQAYPEYCRSVFDKAPVSMSVALQELEKKYGKVRRRHERGPTRAAQAGPHTGCTAGARLGQKVLPSNCNLTAVLMGRPGQQLSPAGSQAMWGLTGMC